MVDMEERLPQLDKEKSASSETPPPRERIKDKLIKVALIAAVMLFGDLRDEPFRNLGHFFPKSEPKK